MAKRKFEINEDEFDIEEMRKEKEEIVETPEVKQNKTTQKYIIANDRETRKTRINLSVEKSLKDRLDLLLDAKKIKSINDFAIYALNKCIDELNDD